MSPCIRILIALGLGTLAVGCASQPVSSPHVTSAVLPQSHLSLEAPRRLYQSAVAESREGRVDEAVLAYRQAEVGFGSSRPLAKSLAIYGRARVLDGAGRCSEAAAAYEEYATFVDSFDPTSAAMALSIRDKCYTPRAVDPVLADDGR
jgi:hypothetical protein